MNVLATVLLLASTSSPYSASAGYSVEVGKPPTTPSVRETQPVGRFRLLMISMNGCGGCNDVEKVAKGDEARSKGWTIGYNRQFDIQITKDTDVASYYNVEYFPTMILLDPAGREAGRVSPTTMARWNASEFFALCTQLYNRSVQSSNPAAPVGNRSLASRYPLRSSWTEEDVASAPTPIEEVYRVIDLLPRPEIGFVDFGCGDGRWLLAAAEKWPGVRITGVEIDPARAAATRERVQAEGLSDRITIITGDATTTKVNADVAVVYLYPEVLERMQPQLEGMRAFASYMHAVPNVPATRNGDTFLSFRQVVQQPQVRGAVWGGQVYNGPVCNNPNCQMCNSIRSQLNSR